MLNELVEKVKAVILQPGKFFERVRGEKDIWTSFKYVAILSLVSLVVGIIGYSMNFGSALSGIATYVPMLASFSASIGIGSAIVSYIISLAMTFVSAGIIHIIAKLLNGKGNYTATYKAMAYSSTPSLLLGWVPWIGIIAYLYSLYLGIVGVSKLHSVSMLRSILIVIALPLIIALVVGLLTAAYLSSAFMFMAAT